MLNFLQQKNALHFTQKKIHYILPIAPNLLKSPFVLHVYAPIATNIFLAIKNLMDSIHFTILLISSKYRAQPFAVICIDTIYLMRNILGT